MTPPPRFLWGLEGVPSVSHCLPVQWAGTSPKRSPWQGGHAEGCTIRKTINLCSTRDYKKDKDIENVAIYTWPLGA